MKWENNCFGKVVAIDNNWTKTWAGMKLVH
jgi:hypothetical protein